MKIGIISNLYPPFIRGGAEVIAALEAEGLKEAWQHVFVISSRPFKGGHAFRTSKDANENLEIYRFFPLNFYYYLNDFKFPALIRLFWHLFDIFNIFSYFKIKKILLAEKPDLVITHNLMGLGFLIPYLLRRLKIRHFHTLHDVQLSVPSGLILKGQENSWQIRFFKILGYPKLMRRLFASPELVISPSKFLLNYYQEQGFFTKSKKVVIPNPIKNTINLPKKASYNLELLFLGQIHKAKGILDLIEVFKTIDFPALNLQVVGVGADLEEAKRLAKDDQRIKFHGWMSHQEMLPIIQKADILVVPSLCYENSPTVIYEMLALGTPILASEIGGVAELISEGKNGWTYPAGDQEILKKKIINLYQQREKIHLLSENCRKSVQAYLLEQYIKKILDLADEKNIEK
ncbi:glycosyltransferase family 4 protein [Candidatus Nomurabacteria bacterium]|nr:glycosyltransferase family 4 protein [Candidatus Nomurabacteria bacterium]